MKIYKTIIVEDNADNAAILKRIIKDNHADISIVAEADTVTAAKEVLLKYKPDIVLMDIELAPGTAFDVLTDVHQHGDIDFEIIFITAHQRYDYITKAIDYSALAFLTKPIDPDLLRGALDKAKAKQTKKMQIEQLLEQLHEHNKRHKKIVVPIANHNKESVLINDISHFEANTATTIIHFMNGTTMTAHCILGHFKKMLMDDHPFFLIHHGILVNVEQIKSFRTRDCTITMKNDTVLTPSRRYGRDFKKYWDEYSVNKNNLWYWFKRWLK